MNDKKFIVSLFSLLLAIGSIIFSIIAIIRVGQYEKEPPLEGTIGVKIIQQPEVHTITETDSTSVENMVLAYTYEVSYPLRYTIIVRDSEFNPYQFWVTAEYYNAIEVFDKFVFDSSYCFEEEPRYKILIDFTSYPVG